MHRISSCGGGICPHSPAKRFILTGFVCGILALTICLTIRHLYHKGHWSPQTGAKYLKLACALAVILGSLPVLLLIHQCYRAYANNREPLSYFDPWIAVFPKLSTLPKDDKQQLLCFLKKIPDDQRADLQIDPSLMYELLDEIFRIPDENEKTRIMSLCIDAGLDLTQKVSPYAPAIVRVLNSDENQPVNIALLERIIKFHRETNSLDIMHTPYSNSSPYSRVVVRGALPNKKEVLILLAKAGAIPSRSNFGTLALNFSKDLFTVDDMQEILAPLLENCDSGTQAKLLGEAIAMCIAPEARKEAEFRELLFWILERIKIESAAMSDEDAFALGEYISLLLTESEKNVSSWQGLFYLECWRKICSNPILWEIGRLDAMSNSRYTSEQIGTLMNSYLAFRVGAEA